MIYAVRNFGFRTVRKNTQIIKVKDQTTKTKKQKKKKKQANPINGILNEKFLM